MDEVEKVGTLDTSKDSPQKKQNRNKGVDLGHTQNTWLLQRGLGAAGVRHG